MNGDWQETRWSGGTVTKRWTRATTAQQLEPARRTMKMNAEATRPSLITVSRFFNLLAFDGRVDLIFLKNSGTIADDFWMLWNMLGQLDVFSGRNNNVKPATFLFRGKRDEMYGAAWHAPGRFPTGRPLTGCRNNILTLGKKGKNSRRMCWRFLIYFYLIYSWCGIFFNKIYFQFYFQVPTGGTFP